MTVFTPVAVTSPVVSPCVDDDLTQTQHRYIDTLYLAYTDAKAYDALFDYRQPDPLRHHTRPDVTGDLACLLRHTDAGVAFDLFYQTAAAVMTQQEPPMPVSPPSSASVQALFVHHVKSTLVKALSEQVRADHAMLPVWH